MNCRFGTKREAPFEIPAGESARLDCTVETYQPGPFEGQLHVFLDDLGLREIALKVRGQAVAAESEEKKKPSTTVVNQRE